MGGSRERKREEGKVRRRGKKDKGMGREKGNEREDNRKGREKGRSKNGRVRQEIKLVATLYTPAPLLDSC